MIDILIKHFLSFKIFTDTMGYISDLYKSMPYLRYIITSVIVSFILYKIKVFLDTKAQIKKNIGLRGEKIQKSKEIIQESQNIIESNIASSDITVGVFEFKFFKYKNNQKDENPDFKKLSLSFLVDIAHFSGSFIKNENSYSQKGIFVKFNSQNDVLEFIKHFEKNVEDFLPILQDIGYDMYYKIVLDNIKETENINNVIKILSDILKISKDFGIYTTKIFKDVYERSNNKTYWSFATKGKYMIFSEMMEVYKIEK